MGRVRCTWDWVGKYPVFIYTDFIDHGKFDVKVVVGKKGDQNAGYNGPKAKAYMRYTCTGKISKNEVADDAFKRVAKRLGVRYGGSI